jgi:hypothetical protein
MMRPSHFSVGTALVSGFVFTLLTAANVACFGQTVIIRLVNVTNESPVRNRYIYISGITGKVLSEQEERRKLLTKPMSPELRLITDANGEVRFELPEPSPDYFYVRAVLSIPNWDCTCVVRVSTEEVMYKGLMAGSPYAERTPAKKSIQPKPGEILFCLRPTPWWWRILYPLEKG